MTRSILCALALMMSGCLYINGGQAKIVGQNRYSVQCVVDEVYCFEVARDTCHGDFVVIAHNKMQLLVSCKPTR